MKGLMMEQITSKTVWSEQLIRAVWEEIKIVAEEELEISFPEHLYPFQIEMITADSMINAYASIGMPIMYSHWSFGKEYMRNKHAYDNGQSGLALELITNDSPCSTMLMEDNAMYQQAMVIAHCVGHNSFFKCNDYFVQWTNAGSIIDYLAFAKRYITQCELRYGEEEVERVLDAAHSLAQHGVDKHPRKSARKMTESQYLQMLVEKEEREMQESDYILNRTKLKSSDKDEPSPDWMDETYDPLVGEENLLYYIMKRAPNMPTWKREILRIVWKINQYFYIQGQTKISNEGWASFCHYFIMTRLEEKGVISSDAFLAFLRDHSGVIFQPTFDKQYYSGVNPYAVGFAIYQDIKRICENPTNEDKKFMPHLIGQKWQDAVTRAAFEYRDDSFIMQFMSPKVARDLALFSVEISTKQNVLGQKKQTALVTDVADLDGFRNLRNMMAENTQRIEHVPEIRVSGADFEGDRTLVLHYHPYKNRELDVEDTQAVISYIDELWGYPVELYTVTG
jgi:spore cortex formation protein SpoVR/YcgB (stage V sporulation)